MITATRKELTPEERLIVAAGFKYHTTADSIRYRYNASQWVSSELLKLARELQDTGITIKLNSALRLCGYSLIAKVHDYGLKVFADLKLSDTPKTLETDGALLSNFDPNMVTVMCSTGPASIRTLKSMLPKTEVLGVTVLTSQDEHDCCALYGVNTVLEAVERLGISGTAGGVDGFVASAKEAQALRDKFGGVTINTPNIRPEWYKPLHDDQNRSRSATPAEAMQLGADRIIVGSPILQADDKLEATLRIIDEIAAATLTQNHL